jgi:hypothetical protein
MQLFTVDSKHAKRYLDSALLSGDDVARLLKHRAISDGTPIYLDDETMMPIEPLCSWARQMSYAELDKTTLTDYGRILAGSRHTRPSAVGTCSRQPSPTSWPTGGCGPSLRSDQSELRPGARNPEYSTSSTSTWRNGGTSGIGRSG